jgi:hypothetical protein
MLPTGSFQPSVGEKNERELNRNSRLSLNSALICSATQYRAEAAYSKVALDGVDHGA